MKKLKLFLLVIATPVILLQPNTVSAQDNQNFKEGTTVVNLGLGLFSSIGYYGSSVKRTPVYAVSAEYGVKKLGPGVLGVGLAFGYQSASYTYNYSPYYYKDKWTTTMFGLRGTYHPDFLSGDKYDVYGAIQLTFDHFGYSFKTDDPYYNTYLYGHSSLSSYARVYLLVGGRYYFSKTFGVFGEIGYDISYLKFGLSIKIDKKAAATTK